MNDYKIGYGKPPKSGQFKRGKSGNPTAAPREASSFRPTWPPSPLVARMIPTLIGNVL